jgi:hypothetical protein
VPLFMGAGIDKLVLGAEPQDAIVPGFIPNSSSSLRRSEPETSVDWGPVNRSIPVNFSGTIVHDTVALSGVTLENQEIGRLPPPRATNSSVDQRCRPPQRDDGYVRKEPS